MNQMMLVPWVIFVVFVLETHGLNITQRAQLDDMVVIKRGPPWAYRNGPSDDAVFEISSHGLSQTEQHFQWDQIKKCEINPPPAQGIFVKIKDTKFTYNDKPFYFLGMNSYHLVWEELQQNSWNVDYTFQKAKDVGFQVVRLWAFSDNLRQDLYTWNQQTFKALDSIIDKAKNYNLKLVLAFINYWEEFNGTDSYVSMVHGTIKDYTVDEFYSNQDVKLAYKSHVCKVINRVNLFSGIKYRDDPTIMAWNLINEPRCPECVGQSHHSGVVGGLVAEWTDEMAAFVKSIDPNHLLTIGAEGFFGRSSPQNVVGLNPAGWSVCTGTDFNLMHKGSNIDYATMHIYPEHKSVDFDLDLSCDMDCKIRWITRYVWEHFQQAKNNLNKPIVIEEFGLSTLEKFTTQDGKTRNYNKLDRIAVFKRILGVFAANLLQEGAGGGAMVWTAAVNHFVDFDGRTVYLDDEGTPHFESQNMLHWEQHPLLDTFHKMHIQLSCTLNEYGGSWIPTPLNDGVEIPFEDIAGQTELDLFRSTKKVIEDAGKLAFFRKTSRVPEQFSTDNSANEEFSRSIIDDALFEEFYSEFLPSKIQTTLQSVQSLIPPPPPPPSPAQILYPIVPPSAEDETTLSPIMKQTTMEIEEIEYPFVNVRNVNSDTTNTYEQQQQIINLSPPSPELSPPPSLVSQEYSPPNQLPPPPQNPRSNTQSPPPPVPSTLPPAPEDLFSPPFLPPPPSPSPLYESYQIEPQHLVSTIQSLLPTYDISLTSEDDELQKNSSVDKNVASPPPPPTPTPPDSVIQSFASSAYNYYLDWNQNVRTTSQPTQVYEILSPPSHRMQNSPPPSPLSLNFSPEPPFDDESDTQSFYGYSKEDSFQSSPQFSQSENIVADIPVEENQNMNSYEAGDYRPLNQEFPTLDQFSLEEQAKTLSQGQCQWRKNINYKGQDVKQLQTDGIEGCCQACENHPQCNIFVFCPKAYGCHNNAEILPYNLCHLKFQQSVADGQNPEVWVEGPTTHLSSGYINYKGQS